MTYSARKITRYNDRIRYDQFRKGFGSFARLSERYYIDYTSVFTSTYHSIAFANANKNQFVALSTHYCHY